MNGKKVFSTFSGIGGSTLGYKLSGYEVIGAVEFLEFQRRNYKANNPKTKIFSEDIRKLKTKDIMFELGIQKGELDILDGSPPCSSFSLAGKRENGWGKEKKYSSNSNVKQKTDDLFYEYIRFVREMQPKIFIAENVKGLIIGKAKGFYKIVIKELENCGYNVKGALLNAKYYNVPQSRERVIIVGVRKDIKKEFNYPKKNKIITLNEAFKKVKNSKEEIEYCTDTFNKYSISKRGKRLKPGTSNKITFNLRKATRNKPIYTITAKGAGCNSASKIIHWENRLFTLGEYKAISSFPQNYKMLGKYEENCEGIARAVPPNMMKEISREALKCLTSTK